MNVTVEAGHRIRTTICFLAAATLSLVACAGKDAPAAAGDSAAGTAATALAGSTVTAEAPSAEQNAADQRDVATYPLTVGHLRQVAQVMRTIQSLEKSDPALKAQWENQARSAGPTTLDQTVARLNSAPRAPEILKSAGISAHDYVYTTISLMYASAAYQMQKSGHPIDAGKLATQVSPANVAFVAAHQKEIRALSGSSSAGDSSRDN
jgi:hypothetical protein